MQEFIGSKIINARSMSRADYNIYRGWDLPADECGSDEGYLVEYQNGGEQNHPDHAGYISWSPIAVFNEAYRPTAGMSTGLALEAVMKGRKVTRLGWNGAGMFIFLVPGSTFTVNRAPLLGIYPEGTEIKYQPHIDIRTANGTVVPWLASQSDLLASDWLLLD